MSEKRHSELAYGLLQSRADGSRCHFRSWPRLSSLWFAKCLVLRQSQTALRRKRLET